VSRSRRRSAARFAPIVALVVALVGAGASAAADTTPAPTSQSQPASLTATDTVTTGTTTTSATLPGTTTTNTTAPGTTSTVAPLPSETTPTTPAAPAAATPITSVALPGLRQAGCSFQIVRMFHCQATPSPRGSAPTLAPAAAPSAATPGLAAADPLAPQVFLEDPGGPIAQTQNISAVVSPSPGRIVSSVVFQISPTDANNWTTFDIQTTPQRALTYTASLDTSTFAPTDGSYDIRAIATDSAGASQTSTVPDVMVMNGFGSTYVALAKPGSPAHGSLTLAATVSGSATASPGQITFRVCAAGDACAATATSRQWKTLGTVAPTVDNNGDAHASVTWDTTSLADGTYEISTSASDSTNDPFLGQVVSGVVVDNTAPTVSLADPGGSLGGTATLNATAQDSGSGVAAVRFEAAPAGSGEWKTLGVASAPPYTITFDTTHLGNGPYDLRAETTDVAGNTAASGVRSGASVTNPSPGSYDNLTLTNYAVPARNMKLLGEIAGSPDHETWGYGFTDAPAPTVNGAPLPYTAQGANQLVLLRFTDESGWRIADVLRNVDGSSGYPITPNDTNISVNGQLTGSGEAWIRLDLGGGSIAVFHRSPRGLFLFDPTATSTLKRLGDVKIRLLEGPGGQVFGTAVQPGGGPSGSVEVPSQTGANLVTIHLQYAELSTGTWTVQSASLPPRFDVAATQVSVAAVEPTGSNSGWGVLQTDGHHGVPLLLARYDESGWHFVETGVDALDVTGQFDPRSVQSATVRRTGRGVPFIDVTPLSLRADSAGVWVGAATGNDTSHPDVVAHYDAQTGRVDQSWCTGTLPRQSSGCGRSLDLNEPATVPDAVFDTADGRVADALAPTAEAIDIYAHGGWTSVPAPGFKGFSTGSGQSVFADPGNGSIVGQNAVARVSTTPPPNPLVQWPAANRNTLLSVALPPGQSTTDTPGALAVGVNGTALHYDPSAGWLVDATPPQTHHVALTSVAFDGPNTAFAVGVGGTILRWDGNSWSADPQSFSVATRTLNAVAFGSDGQGWAVGQGGTIIHFDGSAWAPEQVDPADADRNITSVTVSGGTVFAVAAGNLLVRTPQGSWQPAGPARLPSPAPPAGSLKLVSGLPDGGLVVAGKSVLMERQSGSDTLAYGPQSLSGVAVALSAYRDSSGQLRAFVSVAPPVNTDSGPTTDVGGFPAGDGELLRQSATGFDDLSHSQVPLQSPGSSAGEPEGVVQPDPVLAVATSPDGSHAWAVGGFSGTHAADGIGTDEVLPARSPGWLASAIWRYDAGGAVPATSVAPADLTIPAQPNVVSFAFFSSPLCLSQCAAARDAQPDVNLKGAESEIAAFNQQPGGPAFAVLGGNARGPIGASQYLAGAGGLDFTRLPGLLAPLGSVPLYAAFGPLDSVPTSPDPAQPWADVFRGAPAPFGPGPAPPGITPQGSGDQAGPVSRYYAFDASQNGGTLRVIVLDNSAGSLEASAAGQTAWLASELAGADANSEPSVVIAARPLNTNDLGSASDGDRVAAQLATAGVLGVFTTSGGTLSSNGDTTYQNQPDQVVQVPANSAGQQIPEYEGATLTYQQQNNNGVTWYDVSVDAAARTLRVNAIPVVASLALDPLDGLSVARSGTLEFQAIGRRAPATIATTPNQPTFPGFNQYVSIPAASCSGCIVPSYSFQSSDPTIGDFVAPSAPGSPYPKLTASGKTIASAASGLFCAFNTGTTTVSVTSGLLTSSLPVTVQSGPIGSPCGTVTRAGQGTTIVIPGHVHTVTRIPSNSGVVPPPATNPGVGVTPKIVLPPAPVPAPAAAPPLTPPPPLRHPPPIVPPPITPAVPSPSSPPIPQVSVLAPPVIVPLIPPPAVPIPPGGATVQAAARREEKARKHARQSAYVTRPAGTSAEAWFYPAVGVVTVLALLLIAGGVRLGPRPRPALLELREPVDLRRRR
jgi:hypothetical protein